jgi:ELWxxDGT repeat protein
MKQKLLSQCADSSAVSMRALAICVALSSIYFSAHSQEKLIKDLNRTEYKFYNEYSNLVVSNGTMYFISQNKELWKTSGTTTTRLKSARYMSDLVVSGTYIYFIGEDAGGKELWRSDGTAGGTFRIKDIRPGSTGSDPHNLTDMYGTLYFVTNNGTNGTELWKTNGTAAGTVLVKDINPGVAPSDPMYLCNMNGILMFGATNGTSGRELWKSDGTASGTVAVLAGVSRDANADPQIITSNLNGWVFYTAWQSTTGRELWKSNGTVEGTVRVKDIKRGNVNSNITNIVFGGTHMYFNADDGVNGQALWKTTGHPAGTAMVKDLAEGTGDDGRIITMKMLQDRLYLITENSGDYEIFTSDLTTEGTLMVTRTDDYQDPQFTYHNGFVFYNTTSSDEENYGIYFLNLNRIAAGSTEEITIHQYKIPISYDEIDQYIFAPEMIAFNNGIVFSGRRNEVEGFKLLFSNGSPGNVSILFDTYKPTDPSNPNSFVKANGYSFFLTQGQWGYFTTLWRTDGTAPGTIMLKKMEGSITGLVASGNQVFVTAEGFHYGNWQLWKSNGTVAGTVKVKELTDEPGTHLSGSMIPSSDGGVFFYTPTSKFYKSNGTTTGTVLLKQFNLITQIAPSDNRAFVNVKTTTGGHELWKSNGTVAGTVKVKTIRSGVGFDIQSHFRYASNENMYYFIADDGVHGFELWRTDGTSAGTFMVKDIVQGDEAQNYGDISRMALVGDTLYFNARWASFSNAPWDLYITNGTEASTTLISAEKSIDTFIPYGNKMLFSHRTDYSEPLQLWISNGTNEGTEHIRTLDVTGYNWSWTKINNFVYFTNGSNSIWRTDGTVCATGEFDLNVSDVQPITSVGTKLIFGAYQKFYGKELYELETAGHDPDPCGNAISARSVTEDSEVLTSADETVISSAPNPFNNNFQRERTSCPVSRVLNDRRSG